MTNPDDMLKAQTREILARHYRADRATIAVAHIEAGDWDNSPDFLAVLEALRASIQPADDAVELRPVETAPKDGSYFLFVGTNFDGGMAVVCWDAGLEWWTLDDGKNPEIALRHERKLRGWLPLPALAALAPQGEKGEG